MDFLALSQAGVIIQLHVAMAILAAVLGPLALLRKRRDRAHKTVGYIWVTAMAVTALTSFFIWELRVVGRFSPIHLLSVVTLVGLMLAIYRVKSRQIVAHKRTMWRLYSQAIGIAGLFSFLPNRAMNELFQIGTPWLVFVVAAVCFVTVGLLVKQQFNRQVPRDFSH